MVDEIKYADIQPGDALAISSHIRLVVGINDNNTPNDCTDDTYECIEQTTANLGNKNIGTAKITYTYSQLHNGGYLPYRYNNLDDGSTPDPEPDPEPINFYGYVYNGTSGEEIMGVTVTFKTEDNVIDAVVTDEYGRFEFTTTDAKKNYTFVFSKSGFDTYTSAAITISESYTYLGKIALYEEESPAHIVDSGTCGDNLQWAYYTNGTLMIYGTGDMTDYSQTATGYPWNEYILSSSSGDLYLPGIKKAVLCDGITSLSSQAFVKKRTDYTSYGDYEYNFLTTLQLPQTLQRIEADAFMSCDHLTAITIPKSVSFISDSAFSYDMNKLKYIFVEKGSEYFYIEQGMLCQISFDNGQKTCTRIIKHPSKNSNEMIKILHTVTDICPHAFDNCRNLEYVYFGDSHGYENDSLRVTIGSMAFRNCTNLQEMHLPNHLETLSYDSFQGCYRIKEFKISEKNQYFYTDEYLSLIHILTKSIIISFKEI